MYTLRNVSHSYGDANVLYDINCEIPADKFVFVMGPSGSGKSTLLRLLSFVEHPSTGTLELQLGGRHFRSESDKPWPTVTSVFQRQFLWPHLSLRENIELPLLANGVQSRRERVDEVISLFDMSSFIDRYPNEVSGGQAQRAALARALTLRPQLILIDEAHGGLDLEQQVKLNDHLLGLRHRGVGLIVVTHSLAFAGRYGDHFIVIERGRLVEEGGAGILQNPKSKFLRTIMNANHGGLPS